MGADAPDPSPERNGAVSVHRRRWSGAWQPPDEDQVAVEEPLEMRIEGAPLAVTMRTPGHDLDLVAGFLATEGVIDGPDDLVALRHVDSPLDPQGNTIDCLLAGGVPAGRRDRAQRAFFASSSCGICGKATLDRVLVRSPPLVSKIRPDPAVLADLPAKLRAAQDVFHATGGLHAAGLFTASGHLELIREDIGRHNAVDKVIGARLRADRFPCSDAVLVVSGRAGFELVQKAVVARISVMVAVGAPSSLAVQLAHRSGLALFGFAQGGRLNCYGGCA